MESDGWAFSSLGRARRSDLSGGQSVLPGPRQDLAGGRKADDQISRNYPADADLHAIDVIVGGCRTCRQAKHAYARKRIYVSSHYWHARAGIARWVLRTLGSGAGVSR
jgi:hypothetical protein